jgi:hypothetical protein
MRARPRWKTGCLAVRAPAAGTSSSAADVDPREPVYIDFRGVVGFDGPAADEWPHVLRGGITGGVRGPRLLDDRDAAGVHSVAVGNETSGARAPTHSGPYATRRVRPKGL